MPSKPIKIEFEAETDDYIRGVKKAGDETEKLADTIAKEIPRASQKAADAADADFRRMGDDAKATARATGENMAGEIGEGLASGDLSGTLQGTIGAMFQNITGPASAAAAAGAGIALWVWDTFKKESEARKKEITELFDLTDAVTGAMVQMDVLTQAAEDLGGGDAATGFGKLNELAQDLGVPIGEVADLITGQINPANDETLGLLQEQRDTYIETLQTGGDLTVAEQDRKHAIEEILGVTEDNRVAMEASLEASLAQLEATRGLSDVNMDGHIDDLDEQERLWNLVAGHTGRTRADLEALNGSNVQVTVEYLTKGTPPPTGSGTASKFAGIYGSRIGESR